MVFASMFVLKLKIVPGLELTASIVAGRYSRMFGSLFCGYNSLILVEYSANKCKSVPKTHPAKKASGRLRPKAINILILK